jgi:hypothetical protein
MFSFGDDPDRLEEVRLPVASQSCGAGEWADPSAEVPRDEARDKHWRNIVTI